MLKLNNCGGGEGRLFTPQGKYSYTTCFNTSGAGAGIRLDGAAAAAAAATAAPAAATEGPEEEEDGAEGNGAAEEDEDEGMEGMKLFIIFMLKDGVRWISTRG